MKSIIIVPTVPLKAGENDPFSAADRAAMINAALDREGIRNYEIVTIRDIPSDAEYVDHVKRKVKPFNVVFVGENRLNGMLFSDAGYKIGISKRFLDISSTEVRKRMREGGKWQELVPEGAADYIRKHEFVKRVK